MGVLVHIFDVEPIFQHYGAGGSIDVTLATRRNFCMDPVRTNLRTPKHDAVRRAPEYDVKASDLIAASKRPRNRAESTETLSSKQPWGGRGVSPDSYELAKGKPQSQ